MKHFKETMGCNTPGYTQDFETLPKNQESFRIPSMKLYFTFLGKLWQRCPMHAVHSPVPSTGTFFLLLFFSVPSEFSSAPAEQRLECAEFVQVT